MFIRDSSGIFHMLNLRQFVENMDRAAPMCNIAMEV